MDVVIVGAGAAGLFCAAHAAMRGFKVLVLEHSAQIGQKILVSGGGRCNFTNLGAGPDNYISQNPHFCISALKRYGAADFLRWVESRGIAWVEKDKGQLFCRDGSRSLLQALLDLAGEAGVEIRNPVKLDTVTRVDGEFQLATSTGPVRCQSLVLASGGLSLPKGGASPLAYQLAAQFGHAIVPPRAGLVPLVLSPEDQAWLAPHSGVSFAGRASCGERSFKAAVLVTHRGLSGPAILQISNYWLPGRELAVDFLPDVPAGALFGSSRSSDMLLKNFLSRHLPASLAQAIAQKRGWDFKIRSASDQQLQAVERELHDWRFLPAGTEGYRTAEVTLGGVDTAEVSSKTLESKRQAGLYFIGECLDVTGQLGGYNFQWAWSSAWCCAQHIGM